MSRAGTKVDTDCRDKISATLTQHGHTRNGKPSKLYYAWVSMKSRCLNNAKESYKRYGARGITVCEKWTNSFEAFMGDMGHPPSKSHSIGRIDNNLGYSPENCRWETVTEQARNTSKNLFVSAFGETKPVSAWASDSRCNPKYSTLLNRLKSGWPSEVALTAGRNMRYRCKSMAAAKALAKDHGIEP